jgi:splicing factor 3B subunit 3
VHPEAKTIFVIETDHRTLPPDEQEKILADVVRPSLACCVAAHGGTSQAEREAYELPTDTFGLPRAPAGTWTSSVRVIDPVAIGSEVRSP